MQGTEHMIRARFFKAGEVKKYLDEVTQLVESAPGFDVGDWVCVRNSKMFQRGQVDVLKADDGHWMAYVHIPNHVNWYSVHNLRKVDPPKLPSPPLTVSSSTFTEDKTWEVKAITSRYVNPPTQMLNDGWEPYAVTRSQELSSVIYTHYFRRLV